MIYWIMNKDTPLVAMRLNNELVYRFDILKVHPRYPFNKDSNSINAWILRRKLPTGRKHFSRIADLCNITDTLDYIHTTKCVSLNDTMWVKCQTDTVTWKDISPYTIPFNRAMSELCLSYSTPTTGLDSSFSPELSTGGNFPKCWKKLNGSIYQVKGALASDSTTFGLEPFSEFFAYQLALSFKFNRVTKYTLREQDGMLTTWCKLFTSEKYGYFPMNALYPSSSYKDDFNVFSSINCEDQFRRLMIFDSLIYNKDRHRGNYGVIVRNADFKVITIAPVFDNNLALLSYIDITKSKDTIEELIKYYDKAHETGVTFVKQAKMFMTSSIYQDLLGLRNFKFKQHKTIWVSKERLDFVNYIFHRQLDSILQSCK